MSDTSTSGAPPLANQAKEQAHQAVETGKQVVQQGKEMAGGLIDRTRDQVKTQIGTQKDNAATGLNDVAQALLLSSNHLQEQGQGGVAHYTDAAAEKITQLSGYLRERDVDEVLEEVQNFARQQPALFLGTGRPAGGRRGPLPEEFQSGRHGGRHERVKRPAPGAREQRLRTDGRNAAGGGWPGWSAEDE